MATTRRSPKGISLSRGPALILGTVLLVAGLYFVYMEHGFPKLSQFPNGTAHTNGKAFFGIFGLNGWSGELTAAAGGLLLFGAAQHLLAKTASLIVAIVLAGVGVWALVNHNSALGLFATNTWTILFWFAAALLLLINTTLPRPGGTVTDDSDAQPATRTIPVEPVTVVREPTTTVVEPDTAVAAEPDTAVVVEPDTAVAAEPDTAVASEPVSTVAEPETIATTAPAPTETAPTGTNPSTDTGHLRRPATRV